MKLQDLLKSGSNAGVIDVFSPDPDLEIASLCYDSRQVSEGGLFFAVTGEVTDGHRYIDQALAAGAIGVVSERAPVAGAGTWIQVADIRAAMARLANAFWGRPSADLSLVGITGTNGKTTTAFLVHSLLEQVAPAILMGTVKTRVGDVESAAGLTTPEAIDIQRRLNEGVEAGCRWGAMEVSSHALHFDRVLGCRFEVAVFTNLTQDHLDFHADFEEYFAAKDRLFQHATNPGLRLALLNGDDPWASRITAEAGVQRQVFGFETGADIHPLEFETTVSGSRLALELPGRRLSLETPLIGRHNLYNLMAAVGAASGCGLLDSEILAAVPRAPQVPGRFERVELAAPYTVVIDYAHTPDALVNLLELAASLRPGRILCLFGCGGDRDRGKRPQMAEIAVRMADWATFTSDNPRFEDPEKILQDMLAGVPDSAGNYETVLDREAAIVRLLERARPDDLVLLIGKGHETYQIVQDSKSYFCEREIVQGAV